MGEKLAKITYLVKSKIRQKEIKKWDQVNISWLLVTQSAPTPSNSMDCSSAQASLFMGFSRQDIGMGSKILLQGYLPNPRIKTQSPASPRFNV